MEMDNGAHVLALWQGRASACQLPHPVGTAFFLGIHEMCRNNLKEGFDLFF